MLDLRLHGHAQLFCRTVDATQEVALACANVPPIYVPRIEGQCMDEAIAQGKSTVRGQAYHGNLQTYRKPALHSRSFQLP
jgi:hypothetical protein